MNFTTIREEIKGLLLSSGLLEVHHSKAQVPDSLPAGIVSLATRHGEVRVMTGFAKQRYKFEVHVIVEESEQADEHLIAIIENIDLAIQETLFTEIQKTDFYDSLVNAKNIRIAKFEVLV